MFTFGLMNFMNMFTLLFLCLFSCSQPESVPSKTPNTVTCTDCYWTVVIDSKYDIYQRNQIDLALQAWVKLVPELKYHTYFEDLKEHIEIQNRIIHIHYGYASDMDKTHSSGWTFWQSSTTDPNVLDRSGAEVYVNIDPAETYDINTVQGSSNLIAIRLIVEHELGHAFGLGHVDAKLRSNDIMTPVITWSSTISNEDVGQFYKNHPACRQLRELVVENQSSYMDTHR